MPKSIFDREVFFKMEQMENPFIAARALSIRAREVNTKQKEKVVVVVEEEVAISAPALALDDYLEGRITFPSQYQANSHEE